MLTLWSTLSFLGHYWQWIGVALLVAGALAYTAFVLREWKIAVAAGAIVVLFFSHQWTYVAGYKKHEGEVQAETARLETERQKTIADLKADADKRSAEDATRIATLEKQINDTPKNDRPALPRAAAERLRNFR